MSGIEMIVGAEPQGVQMGIGPEDQPVNVTVPGGETVYDDHNSITVVAGESLSGGRVVSIINGKAFYHNPATESTYGMAIGITKGAASIDSRVDVQLDGSFYESGLGLQADKLYYAGLNGTLTADVTALKVVQAVGVSIDVNTILLNINSQPIIKAQ